MNQNNELETTDVWPWTKILKHVVLPKPKGSPKAGKKEIALRGTMAATFGLLILAAFVSGKSLPSCDQTETTNLVGEIINDMPLVKLSNAQFVSLKNVMEQGHNKDADLRACAATLVTTAGEDNLQYSVKWQDKKAGTFYVEAQILD